jgi:uncharacterized phiE125 gp8 family phage protein
MAEPVTLAEAKAQCRMTEDNSEDTFITSLIAPARAYVERVSRVSFVAGVREETFPNWGDYLEIFRRPITAVDEVAYVDEGGDAATYTGFLATLGQYPLRIYPASGDEFPALADGGTVTVNYTTGAIASTTEEYLIGKRAILLLIGHWFENREAAVTGTIAVEIDFAVKAMLDELRPISAY